jgi:sterol-4alpha-carboxylate 3-dehydrogenase (decarboxylating)
METEAHMEAGGERATLAPEAVLVTGGAGFLGTALRQELARGDGPLRPREVRVLDVAEAAALPGERLVRCTGDVRDAGLVRRAVDGVDVVFHCAAVIDWGQRPAAEVESVNVGGTRVVVEACRAAGVRALVHTSTLDVVYTGRPLRGANESTPVPSRAVNAYCATKAAAEALALAADEPGGTRVVALRPCCIWGEGDPYHARSLLDMARRGPVVRIGDGRARCQHSYVGNVAWAHVLAGHALLAGRADGVAGRCFFVTDFPAQNFFDYMEPIVVGAGYRMLPWSLSLPQAPLWALGAALEGLAAALRPVRRIAPTVSRFAVSFVCQDYTVESDAAARAFGYAPRYGEDEALARTIEHFRRAEARR